MPPPYRTRGTRPLQLWKSWRPSVFGPIQLKQLAVIFRWAMWWEDLLGEGKKSRGNMGGAITCQVHENCTILNELHF